MNRTALFQLCLGLRHFLLNLLPREQLAHE